MKRIFVLGYPNNNLGDDLFFKILLERYPKTEFIFNHASESKILSSYDNAKKINLSGMRKLKYLAKVNAYLLIGGSMFQEVLSPKKWIKGTIHLLIELIMLRMLKKKITFIGFNFGPYKTRLFLTMNKIVFKFVDYLSVRDKETFDLLKKNKKVHFAPDIVFGLNDIKLTDKDKDKSIAVSVMDFGPNVNFQQEYEDFLVKVLNSLNNNIKINLFGFQYSNEIDDFTVAQRVRGRLNKNNISIIQYTGSNMSGFLKMYYKNEFAISSRFHSLVLSLKAGQKIISIDYNIKVENLKKTFDLKNTFISPADFDNLKALNEVINEINTWAVNKPKKMTFYMNMEHVKKESEKHFWLLDQFFE